MTEKDLLDIRLYNILNENNDDLKIKNLQLNSLARKYKKDIKYLLDRYKWLKKMKLDPNIYHLDENHLLIYKIFDEYNKMLNENEIEYYYTSGILSYLLVDIELQRYHHDLDIFINMNDLRKLEKICIDYNFSFERKYGTRSDGTTRIMLKMFYNDIIDIPITVFMYVRENDFSIIQKDYYIDQNGNNYVEYIYNSPSIVDLSFCNIPRYHNNIKYYAISPEALFFSKNGQREKDIYDCNIFKKIVNKEKLKKLENSLKNNLPNTINYAKNDTFFDLIYNNTINSSEKKL